MAKGQKKQKQTPEVLGLLAQAFSIGSTIAEACFFAGIAESTYYEWIKVDPALSEKHKGLKERPVLKARQTVVSAMNNGDVATAKWYLERKRKQEFSVQTQTLEGDIPEPITSIEYVEVDASKP